MMPTMYDKYSEHNMKTIIFPMSSDRRPTDIHLDGFSKLKPEPCRVLLGHNADGKIIEKIIFVSFTHGPADGKVASSYA